MKDSSVIGSSAMPIGDAPPEPIVEERALAIAPRDELRVRAKRYELPLAKTYVQRWGLVEAVREILQNAIDSDSPFEHELRDGRLVVRSRRSVLSPSSLLLGTTSKAADDEKIGSFGEGYKIALLVLLRNGYSVTVRNGDRIWSPEFNFSHAFGADVLCIRDEPAPTFHEGLAFEVLGLTRENEDAIRETCLLMQPPIADAIDTARGRILPSRGGKLYVGGLFVCKTGMNYGYDMKPQFLKLERDRQTVCEYDLAFHTTQMWVETKRFDQMAALMKAGSKDVIYGEHFGTNELRDACNRLFQAENAGRAVVKSQEEADQLARQGVSRDRIAQVNDRCGFYSQVKAAPAYALSVAALPIRATPHLVLQRWFDQHRSTMEEGARDSFVGILTDAAKWSAS